MTWLAVLLSLMATAEGDARSTERNDVYRLLFCGEVDSVIHWLERGSPPDTLWPESERFFLLGLAYAKRSDLVRAVGALERALSLAPGDVRIGLPLAEAYEQLGNPSRTEELLRELLRREPSNVLVLQRLGEVLFREGKLLQAWSVFGRLGALCPDRASYLIQQARCAARLDSLDRALELYRRAAALDSTDPSVWLGLGQVLVRLDSPRVALKAIDRGLALNPRHRKLHRLRGEAFQKLDLLEGAVVEYLEAQSLGDSSGELFQRLGNCYFKLGKPRKAKEAFWLSFRAKPNPVAAYGLGLCYRWMDSLALAVTWFRTALTLSVPDYLGELYLQLGNCLARDGHYAEAVRVLKKALDFSPHPGPVYYALATVYDRYYRDKRPALRAFEQALRCGGLSEEATAYARGRLAALRETLHFQRGRESTGTASFAP